MDNLYSMIVDLCDKKGVNLTQMSKEAGVNRASLTDLKKGRKRFLSAESLTKLANYFDVSIDYILTGEEKKPTPVSEDELNMFDKVMKKMERLSPKERARLLEFVDFYLSNQYNNQDN